MTQQFIFPERKQNVFPYWNSEYHTLYLKQHLINVRDQFSTPVSDEDFESLLKEIEDDELTKIGI